MFKYMFNVSLYFCPVNVPSLNVYVNVIIILCLIAFLFFVIIFNYSVYCVLVNKNNNLSKPLYLAF